MKTQLALLSSANPGRLQQIGQWLVGAEGRLSVAQNPCGRRGLMGAPQGRLSVSTPPADREHDSASLYADRIDAGKFVMMLRAAVAKNITDSV